MSENLFAKFRNLLDFNSEVSCMTGCPVNTDSGRYVQLISEGRYEDAYLAARSPNPFASSCAYVCAAPCEDACRRGTVDEPVSIRSLKKFLTENYGVESNKPHTFKKLFDGTKPDSKIHNLHVGSVQAVAKPNGKTVALIGSGPASLSAAHDLAIRGYKPTVFDELPRAGGMMRYGIPSYRLPDDVLDAEIKAIEEMGVEIKLNHRVNSMDELLGKFDAVFIGVGVTKGRGLKMEGSDLKGVFTALEFLIDSNNDKMSETGNRSVIIGGGLVAMDAARDVRRQVLARDPNAHYEVHVAALEDEKTMPAALSESGRQELEETTDEDIELHPSWGPHRIVGENGKVTGIELKKVLRVFDENGKFSPEFDENNIKTIPCDSVIFAIGQAADFGFIKESDGIAISPRGMVQIDKDLMTTKPGVFAGGDAAFGPRNLIDGVANGKKAAQSIDAYLGGNRVTTEYQVRIESHFTPSYITREGYDLYRRKTPPVADPKDRVGKQIIELSFTEQEAVTQADRCLVCHTSPVYDSDLCIICGRCVDICPKDCLAFAPVAEIDMDGIEDKHSWAKEHGYNTADDITVMIKDEDECIRCGLCATRCPTDAMVMETIQVEEVPVPA